MRKIFKSILCYLGFHKWLKRKFYAEIVGLYLKQCRYCRNLEKLG